MAESYDADIASDSAQKDNAMVMDETKPTLPIDEIGPALQAEFEKNGMHGVYGLAEDLLNKWKQKRLNIAITGRSGTGKSSFINAVRGVRPNHPCAAKVGVTQTTTAVKSYPHPDHENLLLWDIPGVGTPNFPRDTYLKDIEFEKFDYYVILSSDRFMENDLWLASKIKTAGKKFLFVRTKIDESIKNEKNDFPDTFKEEEVLCRIKRNCDESLREGNMEGMPVFLLSSRKPAKWDFRKSMIQLINDCPDLKKDVAILTFGATSKELMEKKKALLQKNIKLYALLSGSARAVSLPQLNLAVDASLIYKASQSYAEQFGLDKRSITNTAAMYKIPMSSLQGVTQGVVFKSLDELTEWLVKKQADQVRESDVKDVPFIFSFIDSGVASFAFTYNTLDKILNDYEECAVKILRIIEEKVMQM